MAVKPVTTPRLNGIFYQGEPVTFAITAGATSYTVTDITGATTTSGSVSASATSLTAVVPLNGWYLLQATGPAGYYAIFPFSVVNADARFPTVPAWGTPTFGSDPLGESPNLLALSAAAMGATRYTVNAANGATADIAAIKANLEFLNTWTVNDPVRGKPVYFVEFPNAGVDQAVSGHLRIFRRGTQTNPANLVVGAGTGANSKKLVVNSLTGLRYTSTTQYFCWVTASGVSDPTYLPNAAGTQWAIGSIYTNTASWTLTFTWTAGNSFTGTISLYCLDFGSNGRSMRVTDGTTTRTVSNYGAGRWIQFPETVGSGGSVTFTFTNTGPVNAVCSAAFFDTGSPTPPADGSGNWVGTVGSQGYVLFDWASSTVGGGGTSANDINTLPVTAVPQETYDNLYTELQLQQAVNAASTWIYAGGAATRTSQGAPTSGTILLDNQVTQGVIGVVAATTAYDPEGVTWFEGPFNEANFSADQMAAASAAFTSVVHAGNAAAKALVPALITAQTKWAPFVAQCVAMGFTPDGLSFHPYNMLDLADLAAEDQTTQITNTANTATGWGVPQFWTEWSELFPGQGVTYTPYPTASQMAHWQAYSDSVGVPKERYYYFYSTSHGFNYASWWQNQDGTLNPQWMAARGVSERLYGMSFSNRITFAHPVSVMLFAARWTSATQQAVMLQGMGAQLSVTLNVTGPATVYDWAGNATVVPAGLVTVAASMLGAWVTAPIAATITVVDVNDGLLILSANQADPRVSGATVTTTSTVVGDQYGTWLLNGDPQTGDRTAIGYAPWQDTTGLPSTLTATLGTAATIDRAVVLCPAPHNFGRNAPTAFTVQYQPVGSGSWTTCYTYSATPSSAAWAGAYSPGSSLSWTRMSGWDHAYQFDCVFAPVTGQAFRVVVTATSLGSDPDQTTATANGNVSTQSFTARFLGLYRTRR